MADGTRPVDGDGEWDKEAVDWLDPFTQPMTDLALRHFALDETSNVVLLDLGCGRGYHTARFTRASRPVRVVGLDINIGRLRYARAHYPGADYVLGNLEQLPFRDGTVDAIFLLSTLQYVDWRAVVGACERLLKPHGKAVFIENLAGHYLSRAYRLVHSRFGWKYDPYMTPRRHVAWSDLGYFRSVLGRADFTAFHLSTPLILAAPALLKKLFGIPMRAPFPRLVRALRKLDSLLLKAFPALAQYCWMVVITTTKGGPHDAATRA